MLRSVGTKHLESKGQIMATVKDALSKIESHEKECAIRYENIEKRLSEGSEKFKRLELLLWGVYPFILGVIFLKGIV
jgi:hypothetical protein